MKEGAARLVRLAIAGFKSFAEPTALDILPGLTGIVGPNGCGKSNVTDALRWAMGEASARSLRGGEMDDVIFAGTTARASRNLAEVTVHLEAEPGTLTPPFEREPELAVTRRIERGAGSVYRVNGREVRARDVQTLFADLATGARSSAMVSQGRVAALVGARPEERRIVLEEAAGVSGLHGRRAEAETRLRAAEDNIQRSGERRALLETQLAQLQKQAKQAARYRTLATAVGEAEALVLVMARARAEAALEAALAAAHAAGEAVRAAVTARDAASLEAETAAHALPALRATEAAARTAWERARLAQEGAQDRVTRARAELEAAAARQATASRDHAHAEQVRRDAETATARLAQEAERLREEAEAHPAALEQARDAAQAAGAALAACEAAATAATERAAGLGARAQALEQVLAAADARARRAREALARLEAERERVRAAAPDPAAVTAAEAALAAALEQVTALRKRAANAEASRRKTEPALACARDRLAAAEAARTKLAAEVSGLAQVLAVRDGERWPPMLDRVEVPAGLEAAVGAALGEELAAADDPAASRYWRELPPLQPESPDGESLLHAVRGPAALRRALSAISLVARADAGETAQAGLPPGRTLVSRDGGVWRWDGYTVRAGAPTATAVRLRQRNRLAELRDRLDGAERDALAARTARAHADAADRAAAAEDTAARSALRGAEQALARVRTETDALRARAEQSQTRLSGLAEPIEEAMRERQEADAAAEEARRERSAAPDLTLLREEVERTRAALAAARAREREASRHLDAIERAGAARSGRLAAIAREQELVAERARDAAFRATDLAARVREAQAEAARLADGPARAAQAAAADEAALGEAASAHRVAAAAMEAGERRATAATAAARSADQSAYEAREALVRAEAARETAAAAREAAALAIAERAGALELPAPPPDVSQAAEERARARWQRLARERDEMGPVNLRAEIEAAALETEIATIDRERDEIGTAIAKLRGVIGNLNREGRERLSATFQQVEQHFQALFARMFGGGRAHLALVGSDDPLLAGLEIYAQPPGKKLATLSLLSGGEQALTALSLIFAVFRCNPAPLCVLDEVDAPLDDANVERFCTLLADMVADTGTRFLVVTHHHLTMARMDRLYGVTMQERGVSRLLSVDLARAAAMVERVAAE